MSENNKNTVGRFYSAVKTIFLLLLVLQIAPAVISSFYRSAQEVVSSDVNFGYMNIAGVIQDSARYVRQIRHFSKDKSLKALLVKIDSPGGAPGSSQAVFSELKRVAQDKPVVAYIENMGASGAYYIAAGANKIVSTPLAIVGSIGVITQIASVKDWLDSWKVKVENIKSGSFKSSGSIVDPITDRDRKYLQSTVDDMYKQFIKDIAQARSIDEEEYKTWSDGRIFTGNQALSLKLVDYVGSISDAVDHLKELAEVEGDVDLISLGKKTRRGMLARLFLGDEDYGDQDGVGFSSGLLGVIGQRLQQWLFAGVSQHVQSKTARTKISLQ